jgi:STE24 endopeptidase
MATTIFIVFLVFFGLQFIFETALIVLNLRHDKPLPATLEGFIDSAKYAKSKAYTLVKSRFSIVTSAVSAIGLLIVLFGGLFEFLDIAVRSLNLDAIATGALYMVVLNQASFILGLPAHVYSTFVIEEKFGFNRTTPGLFVRDTIKKNLLSLVMVGGIFYLVFAFVEAGGSFWWVWAASGVLAVQLLMVFLYPVIITPLFNKFTMLTDEELLSKISDLAGRVGFPLGEIRVMDGSRRTGRSNAYFAGFFGLKRVVLYDTLVAQMTHDELLAILAHEMGHWKLRHSRKRLLIVAGISFGLFYVVALALNWPVFFEAFGLSRPSAWTGFVLVTLFFSTVFYWAAPLFFAFIRRAEYEADRFAVKHGPGKEAMRTAMIRLSTENLSNFTPHPLTVLFHYTHPPLLERLAAIEAAEEGEDKG